MAAARPSASTRTTTRPIHTLNLYPLSVILSYLSERDGVNLLLTNATWRGRILPLFRLPQRLLVVKSSDGGKKRRRYRFVVSPCQDAAVLLDRLNTRRLAGRVRLARSRRRHSDDGGGGGSHASDGELTDDGALYMVGMDVEELAEHECRNRRAAHTSADGSTRSWRWPSNLELLRFPPSSSPTCPPPPPHSRPPRPRQPRVCVLASYPRSGNSLLRSLLERITGVVTGSDTRPDRTLSRALALEHDMVGEGVVQPGRIGHIPHPSMAAAAGSANPSESAGSEISLPFVVKTHYPERRGPFPYNAHSAVLLVRNPYDALDSYWNLCVTNTHTRTAADSVYLQYANKFEELVRGEIDTWCNFHRWWLERAEQDDDGLRILVVRYEDLVLDTEGTMVRVMDFLLSDEGVSASNVGSTDDNTEVGGSDASLQVDRFWRRRIRHALGLPIDSDSTRSEDDDGGERNGLGGTCTSHLGSYRPRTHHSSQQQPSSGERSNKMVSIGKSLRKGRYSDDTLRYMHDRAEELLNESQTAGNVSENEDEHSNNLLKRFGYDIYTQNFPDNFSNETAPSADCAALAGPSGGDAAALGAFTKAATVKVNAPGVEIRPPHDPHGRAMTAWRKGETEGDTRPFPTVER